MRSTYLAGDVLRLSCKEECYSLREDGSQPSLIFIWFIIESSVILRAHDMRSIFRQYLILEARLPRLSVFLRVQYFDVYGKIRNTKVLTSLNFVGRSMLRQFYILSNLVMASLATADSLLISNMPSRVSVIRDSKYTN